MTLIARAKPVAKPEPDIKPQIPRQVLQSTVADPEKTRVHTVDKEGFRRREESKIAEVKPLPKPASKPEPVFTSKDPMVKGTIIITIYENHPYEVEFSGSITGAERDVAWRAMMKGYIQWKHNLAKAHDAEVKRLKGGK